MTEFLIKGNPTLQIYIDTYKSGNNYYLQYHSVWTGAYSNVSTNYYVLVEVSYATSGSEYSDNPYEFEIDGYNFD